MDKPKTTPKDFFMYASGFVALYVSAVSLISLLFAIVNRAFPDALSNYGYYGDIYSGGMRLAIASLIIVFPVYLVIASYLDRYLRANPERKDVAVRRWLTYLTLFLTGAAVITDLVVLVNTFLGGEITARFALKVLSVLVVAGAVFGYYLYDLRKTFSSDMPQRSKAIVAIACVLVFGSLVAGFILIGSPMKARAARFDERRISDLTSIQWQIINYWQQKGSLPPTLADLNDPISSFIVPTDPKTGAAYEYQKSAQDLSFKLCATFELPSQQGTRNGISYLDTATNESWTHGAGTQCFDRPIDKDLYPTRDVVPAIQKGK